MTEKYGFTMLDKYARKDIAKKIIISPEKDEDKKNNSNQMEQKKLKMLSKINKKIEVEAKKKLNNEKHKDGYKNIFTDNSDNEEHTGGRCVECIHGNCKQNNHKLIKKITEVKKLLEITEKKKRDLQISLFFEDGLSDVPAMNIAITTADLEKRVEKFTKFPADLDATSPKRPSMEEFATSSKAFRIKRPKVEGIFNETLDTEDALENKKIVVLPETFRKSINPVKPTLIPISFPIKNCKPFKMLKAWDFITIGKSADSETEIPENEKEKVLPATLGKFNPVKPTLIPINIPIKNCKPFKILKKWNSVIIGKCAASKTEIPDNEITVLPATFGKSINPVKPTLIPIIIPIKNCKPFKTLKAWDSNTIGKSAASEIEIPQNEIVVLPETFGKSINPVKSTFIPITIPIKNC